MDDADEIREAIDDEIREAIDKLKGGKALSVPLLCEILSGLAELVENLESDLSRQQYYVQQLEDQIRRG